MKASLAKEILSSYNDDDEIAFVVYDATDAALITNKDITSSQLENILTLIQDELCSCVDDDLCNIILEKIKEKELNILFYEECPYRYYQKGLKQPRENGMPERSWGYYLPGDEPGWMCGIDGDGCAQDDCPHIDRLIKEGSL